MARPRCRRGAAPPRGDRSPGRDSRRPLLRRSPPDSARPPCRRRRGDWRRPRRRGGRRSRTRRADATRVVCRPPVQPAATMRFQRSVHSGRFSAMVAWSRSMRRAHLLRRRADALLQLRRQDRLRVRVGARIVELLGVDRLHFRIERQVQELLPQTRGSWCPWRCRCRRCRGSRPPSGRPTRPAPSSPSRCRSATCRAGR